jgi:hypothetical protein
MIADTNPTAITADADLEPVGALRAETSEDEVTGQMLSLPQVVLAGAVVADVVGGPIYAECYLIGAAASTAGIVVGKALAGSSSSSHGTK